MESFATGFKRIQDACDEAGVKVEYHGNNYTFTVRFFRHCGEGWGTSVSATGNQNEIQKEPDQVKDDTKVGVDGWNNGINSLEADGNGGNDKQNVPGYAPVKTENVPVNAPDGDENASDDVQDRNDNAPVNVQEAREQQVLMFCKSPRNILEIAEELGYKDKRSVRKIINPLMQKGKLAMTIPDKPNSRNQKYIAIS